MAFAASLALLLGACAGGDVARKAAATAPPLPSVWTIDRKTDRATRAPVTTASVVTTRTLYGTQIAIPVRLELMCLEKRPVVRLTYGARLAPNRATIAYRFDAKPERQVEARVLADSRTLVIEDKTAVAQVLAELARSNGLSVSVATTSAEFKVNGGAEAIEAAYADCPLPDEQQRPPA